MHRFLSHIHDQLDSNNQTIKNKLSNAVYIKIIIHSLLYKNMEPVYLNGSLVMIPVKF